MKTIPATFNALDTILIEALAAHQAQPEPAYDHSQTVALKAERDALLRALAIIATSGHRGAGTRDVYLRLLDQVERDVPAGTMAYELLTRHGIADAERKP